MISYKILNESLDFYESKGFNRIESPWTVTEYVSCITKPKDVDVLFQLKHNDKCLVASGEQSFLYLYLKEFLPKGQFMTITPCYRYEAFDFLHTKYFMKNELIKTDEVNEKELLKIVDICLSFYKQYIPAAYIKKTEFGYDINYKDFELGSYGIRSCDYLEWIYATGCAEPRLSSLMKI